MSTTMVQPNPLRQRRLELGLSQRDVARATGLCRQQIVNLELRGQTPHWPTVAALAECLECEPIEIFPVPSISDRATVVAA
jgi:transcriptional regulator with XRE-family HTH domain